MVRVGPGHHHHHPDAEVEHPHHLGVGDLAQPLDLGEDPWNLPLVASDHGAGGGGQHAGQITDDPAAGDVGDGSDVNGVQQLGHDRCVDHRRLEQLLGQRAGRSRVGRAIEGECRSFQQDPTGERVPVAAQPRRRQADEHVSGLDPLSGDEPIALDHADGEADQVELVRHHGAGMLGHLAPDQGAPSLKASGGHPLDERDHLIVVEAADGDVVEHEQRLGPLAHEVVDAHRDQVDADGVIAAHRPGHHRLGADPVGGGHQHGMAVAGGLEREQPTESPDVADHLAAKRGSNLGANALHGPLPGGDVDSGGRVGLGPRRGPAHASMLAGTARALPSSSTRARSSPDGGMSLLSSTSSRWSTGTSTG